MPVWVRAAKRGSIANPALCLLIGSKWSSSTDQVLPFGDDLQLITRHLPSGICLTDRQRTHNAFGSTAEHRKIDFLCLASCASGQASRGAPFESLWIA